MKLIFATNNRHKVDEIKAVLPDYFQIVTLKEAGIDIDIPEPHDTLEANAEEKAITIFRMTDTACFSEDTGLEVFALNGEPGVHSARYAGEEKSFAKNIEKLLKNLEGKEDRSAQFRAVICLIVEGNVDFFEGVCKGQIIAEQKGTEGFGYDPVFIPDGATKTFAEMNMDEKNFYSHRRKAVDKLVAFLGGKNTGH
ncbi:RdgB/HAM1 family non-canonical purine NTP pyrophosphatase [Flavisolibacter ginsenosidimutans]|uniref:dITP/XTP pyrophosphatase n=1 Tax=Flavisolibacter ginsenosidimutans TaxID=661481 RepID=A0A5B8UHL4_9BACT|nr:RdgB/HAM1 family non-canonical purine NTP pyrophosphatase [Flavisolibacter ginsenosidimutans]QEC56003.1 RdgB/HAM1 family non-canonical purine NTP pyrophosphatase [Flavisolibacter ginsenosidimutans]